uniref:Uncharacterized protein n=1 Tax=Arundo donax TaxID=35708 RepID=A0A0A9E6U4_ARUDO
MRRSLAAGTHRDTYISFAGPWMRVPVHVNKCAAQDIRKGLIRRVMRSASMFCPQIDASLQHQ